MRAVAIFASLLLVGCTAEAPADWYGDESFTPTERLQIETGAVWLYENAGLTPPRISWTYIPTSSQPLPKTIRRDSFNGTTGYCTTLGGTVYLNPMATDYLDGLAAHELAHCVLGFEDGYHHDDTPTDGIMRVLAPMRWTDAEKQQCLNSPVCKGKP